MEINEYIRRQFFVLPNQDFLTVFDPIFIQIKPGETIMDIHLHILDLIKELEKDGQKVRYISMDGPPRSGCTTQLSMLSMFYRKEKLLQLENITMEQLDQAKDFLLKDQTNLVLQDRGIATKIVYESLKLNRNQIYEANSDLIFRTGQMNQLFKTLNIVFLK